MRIDSYISFQRHLIEINYNVASSTKSHAIEKAVLHNGVCVGTKIIVGYVCLFVVRLTKYR